MFGVTASRSLAAAVILAAVLVSADCGGSGSPPGPSPSPTPTPPTTPTPPAPPVVNPCSAVAGFFERAAGHRQRCRVHRSSRPTDSSVVWLQLLGSDGLRPGVLLGHRHRHEGGADGGALPDRHDKSGGRLHGRRQAAHHDQGVLRQARATPASGRRRWTWAWSSSRRRWSGLRFRCSPAAPLTGGEVGRDRRLGHRWRVRRAARTLRCRNADRLARHPTPTSRRTSASRRAASARAIPAGRCSSSSGGVWAVAGVTSSVTSRVPERDEQLRQRVQQQHQESFILKYVPGASER